jgi:hypothetical protein
MKSKPPAVADAPGPAVPEVSVSRRNFVTTAELQRDSLPLSRRAIFDWRQKKIIPYVQVGSKVLFHLPSVEAALVRLQKGVAA